MEATAERVAGWNASFYLTRMTEVVVCGHLLP